MHEITPENAVDFLKSTGRIPLGAQARAEALGWGVSNVVIRIDVENSDAIILKQSRAKLRVAMEWISRIDRIWTEVAALRLLGEVLDPGTVPQIVFEDRDEYAFAMTAAPDGSRVWKEMLLEGDHDLDLARRAGALLGTIHQRLKDHAALTKPPLNDREVFDQLRVDPFYRTLGRVHPDLVPALDRLIAEMEAPEERTFVHADFSPKNLLIAPDRSITLVDFETAHAGDPAFDVGFFLSHLYLKAHRTGAVNSEALAVFDSAWSGYLEARGGASDPLKGRCRRHLAACVLARIDGKSPVDYLNDAARDTLRAWGRRLLVSDDSTLFD